MWFRILRGEQSFNLAKDGEFTKKIKVKLAEVHAAAAVVCAAGLERPAVGRVEGRQAGGVGECHVAVGVYGGRVAGRGALAVLVWGR
jgi:hypothetical protein